MLLPGHNYQESIINALEGAKGRRFFSSRNSPVRRVKPRKELSVAAKPQHSGVFPLRPGADYAGPVPCDMSLQTRQWIDLSFPIANRG